MHTSYDDEGLPVHHRNYDKQNPLALVRKAGGQPDIVFRWKEVKPGKSRLIGIPNRSMRSLHKLFKTYQEEGLSKLTQADMVVRKGVEGKGKVAYPLTNLPSSTAFVKKSNPLKNAEKHVNGMFFYITDLCHAYMNVDLKRLAAILVYIKKSEIYRPEFDINILALEGEHGKMEDLQNDKLYHLMLSFLRMYCGGIRGEGLAVGAPLSPYLFNVYCEVYIDRSMRKLCEAEKITYTRYADDLVFSSTKPIAYPTRKKIREIVTRAKFSVNHRKSKILSRKQGTVFVTKVGIREEAGDSPSRAGVLVFPQKKRRKLHGMIKSYLTQQMDSPYKVSGHIAEFLYYYKQVNVKTKTDEKTFALCRAFKAEWEKYESPKIFNRS